MQNTLQPAPSGPFSDEVRFGLTSTQTMVEYEKRGWTDYCRLEIAMALGYEDKLVIPVYPGNLGSAFVGEELGRLSGLSDVSGLGNCNAFPLHPDMYRKSVDVIHLSIVSHFYERKRKERFRAISRTNSVGTVDANNNSTAPTAAPPSTHVPVRGSKPLTVSVRSPNSGRVRSKTISNKVDVVFSYRTASTTDETGGETLMWPVPLSNRLRV